MSPFVLSKLESFGLSFAFAGSYVGCLYLSKQTRTGPGRDRNHPNVIRARLAAVGLCSVGCCVAVWAVVWRRSSLNAVEALKEAASLLGFTLPSRFVPFLLTPAFYKGTVISLMISNSLPGYEQLVSWIGLRNYVLSPLTEEIVFRSCSMAVSRMAGFSPGYIIWATPLYFGIAHLHHAREQYKSLGNKPGALRQVTLVTLFQLTYTTLFGSFAAFLLLRTGSILPSIASHITCNLFGIPSLLWDAHQYRHRPLLRLLIYGAHAAGIAGFAYCLFPWTQSATTV